MSEIYRKYISLGQMCDTLNLFPYIEQSLPFDSIDNRGNIKYVYEILKELKNNSFDTSGFCDPINSDSLNKYGFWMGHFININNLNETRLSIFTRRFQRLKNILSDKNIQKRFIYLNTLKTVGSDHMFYIEKIHNLFPDINFAYFDKFIIDIPISLKNSNNFCYGLANYEKNCEKYSDYRQVLGELAINLSFFSEIEKICIRNRIKRILNNNTRK